MSALVQTQALGALTRITMDDGKVNALSLAMLEALDAAFAAAARAGLAVLVSGREQVFSAGFDLATLRRGGNEAAAMLEAGARLAARMLALPVPIVAAVNGHAMAMGAFVALGADHRIGVAGGTHRIAANEVAIGLTLPRFATALLRHRLTAPAFASAAITARSFSGEAAVAAGWLHELAPVAELDAVALERVQALAALDRVALAATKSRVHAPVLAALEEGIGADVADWQARMSR